MVWHFRARRGVAADRRDRRRGRHRDFADATSSRWIAYQVSRHPDCPLPPGCYVEGVPNIRWLTETAAWPWCDTTSSAAQARPRQPAL